MLQGAAARSGFGTQQRKRLRAALVIAETAVALILLVAAGVVIQSFLRLETVNPGMNPDGVMIASVARPQTPNAAATQISFEQTVLERLRSSPGVTAAAIGTPIPFSGGNASGSFAIEGRTT